MSSRSTVGRCLGGAAKYRWLVLKVQEYPVNLALLKLAESGIGARSCSLMEAPRVRYAASPTENKAVEIADLKRRIAEVEQALMVVPEEYRNGVLYHTINHGTGRISPGHGSSWQDPRFDKAHRNTWKKWKTRFLLEYAAIIGELDHIKLLIEYEDLLSGTTVPNEKIYHFQ
ncbi:MAG: hypothetical protein IJM39_05260 [Firmicutes bacterium]|nr:hypothetical protein [Bacillota bacterium]